MADDSRDELKHRLAARGGEDSSVRPYQDVNIVDLGRIVGRRKGIFLVTLLVSIAAVLAYLTVARPFYRAEVRLLIPTNEEIKGLLVLRPYIETEAYTTEAVYKRFLTNLHSRALRKEFFEKYDLQRFYEVALAPDPGNLTRLFSEQFDKYLSVEIDRNDPEYSKVSFAYVDATLAAEWVNQFVEFVNQRTVKNLYDDVDALVQAEIRRVRDQIRSKLELAGDRKTDKVERLEEALQIAKTLNISDPAALFPHSGEDSARFLINTANMPVYMYGEKVLQAEIIALDSRKSEEPFIDGLRDLEEKLSVLENLSTRGVALSAARVDSPAAVPYRPEGPRKAVILALGLTLGLVLAIFMVFFAEMLVRARKESDQTQQ